MARPKFLDKLQRERKRKLFETERLPKAVKEHLKKKPFGLGTSLGAPLPDIKTDWIRRVEQWKDNREKLEQQFPGIFTNEFLYNLQRVGGRKEGEARRFHLGKENMFVSANGMHWYDLVIKKFNKGARSSPENQAKTLHSLHVIYKWLIESRGFPKPKNFELLIPEVITYKGPFSVMRYIEGAVTLEKVPKEFRNEIWNYVLNFGKSIYHAKNKVISHFENAGLVYPSPDFNPSNILVKLRPVNNVVYIIDQFSEKVRAKEPRFRHGSMRYLHEERPTTRRRDL